jgi:hypothetical protein
MAADPPAAAQPAPQPLPGVTVEGKSGPLDRSDRRVEQLQGSLPALGGEAQPHKRGLRKRLADYMAKHKDPNKATGQQRAMMERAQTPPEPQR